MPLHSAYVKVKPTRRFFHRIYQGLMPCYNQLYGRRAYKLSLIIAKDTKAASTGPTIFQNADTK